MLSADRTSLGAFVAFHRTRLGLSENGLASRTSTLMSTNIRHIEAGLQPALRPKPARSLARALELDDYETDHFLQLAGCAPNLDWQALAEEILTELGLATELHERAEKAYAALRPRPTKPKETPDAR